VVILAQFSDDKFIDEDPKSVFDQYLNAEEIDNSVGNQTVGANYGSVRRYFKDMSGGLFEPQFDIYGPVTLPNPTAYYGAGTDDMSLFIPDVCKLAVEQGVDFSPYDANDDGIIDLVYVIYAGYAESFSGNASTCIWPKSGITYANVNGKRIFRYGVNAELNGFPGCWPNEPFERISGIGLFCHEFSHCMGMPDFYPTNKEAQNAMNPGMEMWSLMDNGEYAMNGYSPTAYTAWEREAFEWFTIDTLKTSGTYQLRNIDEPNGNAYRIVNEENPNEYFILQNIQKSGWNKGTYGHGMLVTHVDYDPYAFTLTNNSVNNTIGRSRMTVIPADGYLLNWYEVGNGSKTSSQYYQSHAGDPYPGSADIHEIPLFTTYTGTMKAHIEAIDETDGVITFYFNDGTTGIRDILTDPEKQTKTYTVDGRFVGNTPSSLPKGIYIVSGRKVAIY
jgi:immune inhibitor A